MARRPDDVTIQLTLSEHERAIINTAYGRGNVNRRLLELALADAQARLADQPSLDQLALTEAPAA